MDPHLRPSQPSRATSSDVAESETQPEALGLATMAILYQETPAGASGSKLRG